MCAGLPSALDYCFPLLVYGLKIMYAAKVRKISACLVNKAEYYERFSLSVLHYLLPLTAPSAFFLNIGEELAEQR